jgi:hypothetical protein
MFKRRRIRESSEVTVSELIDYLQGVIDRLEDEYNDNDIVNISPNTYRMLAPMYYSNGIHKQGYIDLADLDEYIESSDE